MWGSLKKKDIQFFQLDLQPKAPNTLTLEMISDLGDLKTGKDYCSWYLQILARDENT